MARTHKVVKSPTLKSHQGNESMEEYERKNKKNTKELQGLDPKDSPHLEERWIGGYIDPVLLSLFPRNDARIMKGIEIKQAPRGH